MINRYVLWLKVVPESLNTLVAIQSPIEHEFTCPYCWETISMVLEPTSEIQEYVEDCEVCCNPIAIRFRGDGALEEFQAEPLGQ